MTPLLSVQRSAPNEQGASAVAVHILAVPAQNAAATSLIGGYSVDEYWKDGAGGQKLISQTNPAVFRVIFNSEKSGPEFFRANDLSSQPGHSGAKPQEYEFFVFSKIPGVGLQSNNFDPRKARLRLFDWPKQIQSVTVGPAGLTCEPVPNPQR
jgi:hypothetical protein